MHGAPSSVLDLELWSIIKTKGYKLNMIPDRYYRTNPQIATTEHLYIISLGPKNEE